MTYRHFKIHEFDCNCCGENKISHEFVVMLDRARSIAKIPFRINSGYRCLKHNLEVGGKDSSSHTLGLAADIYCITSRARFTILTALIHVGFKRVGVSGEFIHVDSDKKKPQRVVWTY